MKKVLFLSLAGIIFLAACTNNSSNTIVIRDKENGGSVTINVTETEASATEMEKKVQILKGLTPLSPDELLKFLPESVAGMKKTTNKAGTMIGLPRAEAAYSEGDDKRVKISIFDCAGETGAGFYFIRYGSLVNAESKNDDGYTKTIEFNNGKAIESHKNNSDEYTFLFNPGNRLLVIIEGKNTGRKSIKEAAKKINPITE